MTEYLPVDVAFRYFATSASYSTLFCMVRSQLFGFNIAPSITCLSLVQEGRKMLPEF